MTENNVGAVIAGGVGVQLQTPPAGTNINAVLLEENKKLRNEIVSNLAALATAILVLKALIKRDPLITETFKPMVEECEASARKTLDTMRNFRA